MGWAIFHWKRLNILGQSLSPRLILMKKGEASKGKTWTAIGLKQGTPRNSDSFQLTKRKNMTPPLRRCFVKINRKTLSNEGRKGRRERALSPPKYRRYSEAINPKRKRKRKKKKRRRSSKLSQLLSFGSKKDLINDDIGDEEVESERKKIRKQSKNNIVTMNKMSMKRMNMKKNQSKNTKKNIITTTMKRKNHRKQARNEDGDEKKRKKEKKKGRKRRKVQRSLH